MNFASDVPDTGPSRMSLAGGRRFTLRAKGVLLFSLVSLYVVGAAALLIVQATQLLEQRQEMVGSLEPLIWVALAVGLLGLMIFGAFLTLFLSRLASDLARLQTRALEVANGYRGASLDIERDDEVGALAQAVNKMASDLDAREREISTARLEQFHSERITLLGGIAAGVAHEIGNPVAGIAAIANELLAAARQGRRVEIDAEMLRGLAERVAEITRRLALTAGIRSKEQAPVALNPVLESVSALLRFDHRFKPIELAADFDPVLPLVYAAEDDIVQLLLHLLMNAAEALEGADQHSPRIEVATRRKGAWAEVRVQDNGRGMDERTLARAFEPLFTTKPAGKGNGLGLDACRRIVQRYGGEITLASHSGRGTSVLCRFPAIVPTDTVAL
ncbi:MAG: HAMP domain-containing histidine kinase [Betaproteobacteria bacterium]|nr:HAMP domain-containing histidine kinase [Betaproteobacteria bacterium]